MMPQHNNLIQYDLCKIYSILRHSRTRSPQWITITDFTTKCSASGITEIQVLDAIQHLIAEGFLEKKEESIRVIPLC
jgi:hypothetical protein